MSLPLLRVSDTLNVYADAVLSDESGYLAMASLWGRDTGIQELMARMTLPPTQDGLDAVRFEGEQSFELLVGDHRRFTSVKGRVKSSVFGELAQVFIFDERFLEPDYANRRTSILGRGEQDCFDDRAWFAIKDLAPLPLLDEWRIVVVQTLTEKGWLKRRHGFGVHGIWIELPEDEFDQVISDLVKSRRLPVADLAA